MITDNFPACDRLNALIIKPVKISFLFLLMMIFFTALSPPAFAATKCAPGDHQYSVTVREPTATADGAKLYECDLCDDSYTQILHATEHKWGGWVIDKKPTCTEPGERHRTCTATGIPHMETDSVAAPGHEYEAKTKDPGCTESGTKTHTCKRCNHSYTETLAQAHGHKYADEITTPPTYDKEGIRTFTCEDCGDTYTEVVAKVTEHEHQYIVKSEVKAGCEQNGFFTHSCTICADSYTETIPATGHSYGEWITDKEPGLFDTGQRHRACVNNPVHVESEDIPRVFSLEMNTADAVLTPVNTGLLLFFVLALLSDLYVILWDLRKRRKSLKAKKLKIQYTLFAVSLLITITGVPLVLLLFIRGMTYLNLLGITAVCTIIPAGLLLRIYSHRRRLALNGSGGIYEPGAQKGHLVSRNRVR